MKKSVPKMSPRKNMSTVQNNIKAVITNSISEWARSSTFDNDGKKVDEAVFEKWETWFTGQIKCRFWRQQRTTEERANFIGLGRRSNARDNMLIDEEARFCDVTDARRLS